MVHDAKYIRVDGDLYEWKMIVDMAEHLIARL